MGSAVEAGRRRTVRPLARSRRATEVGVGGGTGRRFNARDPTLCCSCSLFLNHSGDAQGVRHQQRLHVSTASHLRVRWFKTLAQLSP